MHNHEVRRFGEASGATDDVSVHLAFYSEDELDVDPEETKKEREAITGTTTSLGFALAQCAVVKNAALVLLLNRESERSKESEENLRRYLSCGDGAAPKTAIKSVNCDLTSFDSVRAAAAEVNRLPNAATGQATAGILTAT